MNRYWKAWGALIGSALGLAGVYGFVPEGTDAAVSQAINTLAPVLGAVIGTVLAPKNAD